MLQPFYDAFGALMKFIYEYLAFHSYGLAIIIFTILTKLVLMPLSIKQYKTTFIGQRLQPELKAIQKLYKDDPQRMQEEISALYKRHGSSQFSGCLPTLIQFPIIIVLYDVIRKPLTYIMGMSQEVLGQIVERLKDVEGFRLIGGMNDISILNYLSGHADRLANVPEIAADKVMNLNFLGIFNLGVNPTINPGQLFGEEMALYLPLLLIPVLAAVTTYIQSKVLMKTSVQKVDDEPDPTEKMTKGMNVMMPIMILVFAFGVPSGLGLYWIIGNVIAIVQQFIFNKFLFKDKASKEEIK